MEKLSQEITFLKEERALLQNAVEILRVRLDAADTENADLKEALRLALEDAAYFEQLNSGEN